MHYHLEVIMPPADDVRVAITEIMKPFDEGEEDSHHPFWDWWVIGGRWSGNKLLSTVGSLDQFYERLKAMKITVSSITCGKQTLSPPDQADKVNALWNEIFPDAPMKECPLFDSYKGGDGDVMAYGELPTSIGCERVIVAAPNYKGEGLEAV